MQSRDVTSTQREARSFLALSPRPNEARRGAPHRRLVSSIPQLCAMRIRSNLVSVAYPQPPTTLAKSKVQPALTFSLHPPESDCASTLSLSRSRCLSLHRGARVTPFPLQLCRNPSSNPSGILPTRPPDDAHRAPVHEAFYSRAAVFL